MAERRLVEVAGPAAADVEQDHPDRAADGRVGAIAGAEAVMPGVHADLLADRTVHHQERRHHMRRRLHAVEIEGLIAEREQRSEEHTSELQSLMRISYAVFCLKKKKK